MGEAPAQGVLVPIDGTVPSDLAQAQKENAHVARLILNVVYAAPIEDVQGSGIV